MNNCEIIFNETFKYLYVSFVYSFISYCVSFFIFKIKGYNVLKIDYNIYTFLMWVTGSVLVWFIFDSCGIIKRTNISVLLLTLAWDTIFYKIYNKAQNNETPDDLIQK